MVESSNTLNVVVFGILGEGKSTLLNIMAAGEAFVTSN